MLDSTLLPGVFRTVASKRGTRLGWQKDGDPTCELYLRHSKDRDAIYWAEASDEDLQELAQAKENRQKEKRGGRPSPWSYCDVAKILDAADEGMSIAEIADKMPEKKHNGENMKPTEKVVRTLIEKCLDKDLISECKETRGKQHAKLYVSANKQRFPKLIR